jgi:hypothetical protein
LTSTEVSDLDSDFCSSIRFELIAMDGRLDWARLL